MQQMKWELLLLPAGTPQKALDGDPFGSEMARRRILASKFQEIYYGLFRSERELDTEQWFAELAEDVKAFVDAMVLYRKCPSLIEMDVPFAVRRQLYDQCRLIGAIFESSVIRANGWAPGDERAMWNWYYSVFLPVAQRFITVGSEHHFVHSKSR